MQDRENKIVPLKPAKPSPEGWGPREQEALLLARLGAMPQLEYERARLAPPENSNAGSRGWTGKSISSDARSPNTERCRPPKTEE
jgi:hypothetical protein